jgi:MHS family proline/betaine transporter-like MFS transporter
MFSFKLHLKRKIILACLCANAFIFYNFTLCGVYIGTLSNLFFPPESAFSSLLGGIITFSAAFVTRPLGALVFGYIGDRFGRKKALTLSKILAGLPMLIMALLPTYKCIGIAAPCLLLICRLLQGICTGGGYNGAGVFMLEHTKLRPGLISGFLSASCVVGALLATISAVLVSYFPNAEHGWRIPFFLGTGIIFVSLYIKKIAGETEDFTTKKTIQSSPLVELIKKYPKQYVLAILTGVLNGLLSYTLFGFLNIYLSKYIGVNVVNSLIYNLFGLLSFMVSCLVFGHLYDLESIKKQQPLFLSALVVMVASWLGFLFIQEKHASFIILGQTCLGVGVGAFVGPSHAFLQEQFLPEVRYTGVASGFSLGMALSGSMTLLLMSFMLNTFDYLMAPAVILLIMTYLWFAAYKSMKKSH